MTTAVTQVLMGHVAEHLLNFTLIEFCSILNSEPFGLNLVLRGLSNFLYILAEIEETVIVDIFSLLSLRNPH